MGAEFLAEVSNGSVSIIVSSEAITLFIDMQNSSELMALQCYTNITLFLECSTL